MTRGPQPIQAGGLEQSAPPPTPPPRGSGSPPTLGCPAFVWDTQTQQDATSCLPTPNPGLNSHTHVSSFVFQIHPIELSAGDSGFATSSLTLLALLPALHTPGLAVGCWAEAVPLDVPVCFPVSGGEGGVNISLLHKILNVLYLTRDVPLISYL